MSGSSRLICPSRVDALISPRRIAAQTTGGGLAFAGTIGHPLLHSLACRKSFNAEQDFFSGSRPANRTTTIELRTFLLEHAPESSVRSQMSVVIARPQRPNPVGVKCSVSIALLRIFSVFGPETINIAARRACLLPATTINSTAGGRVALCAPWSSSRGASRTE